MVKRKQEKRKQTGMHILRKLVLCVLAGALSGCGSHAPLSEETVSPSATASEEEEVYPEWKIVNEWDQESLHYYEVHLGIVNESEKTVRDWKMTLFLPQEAQIQDYWNCSLEGSTLKGVDYNTTIQSKSSLQDVGLICGVKKGESVSLQSAEVTFEDGSKQVLGERQEKQKVEATASPLAVQPQGKLHVEGTHLVNEDGEIVQLKGVSTHGLAWYPQYVNKEAFSTLKLWGVNVVRLALYTEESGGYCMDGNQEELKVCIDRGVQYARETGMYVIIDWHILSDGNPMQHKEEAIRFFDEMSQRYGAYSEVIYEICNEPQNSPWDTVIRPYAEEVLRTIRKNSKDSLVLVGTNTWSQDVDEVIGSPLEDDHVLYTCHFYAGTHKEALRDKVQKALDSGIPVFVSECSLCDASGNGGIDLESADAWLSFLNQNRISFVGWSLCNKDETSAWIRSSCNKVSDWDYEDLSETGQWFYKAIKE